MAETSNSFTDSIAKRYDSLSQKNCCLSCGGALSFAEIKPGDHCIDLGCGKGRDVLRMATLAGDTGRAYGVDISDGMMETARKHAGVMGLENIDFVKAPLERIPLEDGIADVIISNCTINHSMEQDKVWQEIARLLKVGGHFVVSDIYALEPVPEEYRSNPDMVAECWAGAVTREKYFEHLVQAGLKDLELLEESEGYEKGRIRVASFTVRGRR